ncbi:MAG: hypothetical protein HW421_3569 [Ignavibacteria bacterium]|nr:hypothetical protein [Ignavibacteria bacterium]
MNGQLFTSLTKYDSCSHAIHPPADSAFITVQAFDGKNDTFNFKKRFIKGITYNYIVLPAPKNSARKRPADTLLEITSSPAITQSVPISYLRAVNAVNDSMITYTISNGCPSGAGLASYLTYRSVSSIREFIAGDMAVSLIKHTSQGDSVLGLFKLNLVAYRQYLLIIRADDAGNEKLILLDQQEQSPIALSQLQTETGRKTNIRAMNFSSMDISVIRAPGDIITTNLNSNKSDAFVQIDVCGQYPDTISVQFKTIITAKQTISLNVAQHYSIMVFDSADKKSGTIIAVNPVKLTQQLAGRASVRVVNGYYPFSKINLYLGARNTEDSSRNFKFMDTICTKLDYGTVSAPVLLEPGKLPLALFTFFEPGTLLFCGIPDQKLESNKNYLLIISTDDKSNPRITLLEDSESDLPNNTLNFIPEGVFIQTMNLIGIKDATKLNFSLDDIVLGKELMFSESYATVISEGRHSLGIGSKKFDFDAVIGNRVLALGIGAKDNIDTLIVNTAPMEANSINSKIRIRFINACKDIQSLFVQNTFFTIPELGFRSISSSPTDLKDQKYSFIFKDAAKPDTLAQLNEFNLSSGTNHSVIFTGSPSDKVYQAIKIQEY